MYYANLTSKKVLFITSILVIIVVAALTTALTWGHAIGTFSIPSVEFSLNNEVSAWQYRLEFNSQFGAKIAGADSLLAATGLFAPNIQSINTENGNAQAIPVLLYHGLEPASTGADVTTVDNFKQQMFALKNAGWQTVSIEDFVSAMQGKTTLPAKSFLLTFDDGRQDAYVNATPILTALGYKAVMYVITGHSLAPNNQKSKYYVTETQLGQMLNSGVWELQSHSDIGHAQYPIDAQGDLGDFYGNRLWIPTQNTEESNNNYQARIYDDMVHYFENGTKWPLSPGRLETNTEYASRITTDLTDAKTDLAKYFGIIPISFAYPYNDFAKDLRNNSSNGSPVLTNIVNNLYAVSFYQWYPSSGNSENYPGQDEQLLRRIEPKPTWTATYLLNVLDNGQPKSLPYNLGNDDGWQDAWGTMTQQNGTMNLSATNASSGASAVLDGTRLWGNYTYTVDVSSENANSISLLGHYQADPLTSAYIDCDFGPGSVRLETYQNGNTTTIAQNTKGIAADVHPILTMNLNGNYAECLLDNTVVTQGYLPSGAPKTGGIGIEAWSPTLGTANAAISSIRVLGQ